MINPEHKPYLSVVVTSRNDNHGGDLNHRMQIFIRGFIAQCRRFNLEAELIIVEWNPPTDKPSLAQQFDYPVQDSPCTVRIITVPPELHRHFDHSDQLPLFQMIAKNVGIRRARGQFVVATNIDLLFSDELMAFLAQRSLKSGILYRVDRHDVDSDVPKDAPIEEQLAYGRSHLLRICACDAIIEMRTGTYYWIYTPSVWEVVQQASLSFVGSPEQKSLKRSYVRSVVTAYLERLKSLLSKSVSRLMRLAPDLREINWRANPRTVLRAAISIFGNELSRLARIRPRRDKNLLLKRNLIYRLRLFTNACGDFTLMSREDWFSLRAYPELELFSLHIDSLMLYVAHYGGVKQQTLPSSMVTYHIEHKGGWTPESARDGSLDKRLREKKIEQLTMEQLYNYVWTMEQQSRPIQFNGEHWGLINADLPEVEIKHSSPSPTNEPKSA